MGFYSNMVYLNMREDLIRMLFSLLAAAVTLAMSGEWSTWALKQKAWWKLIPAAILAGFAIYESQKVWIRMERILGI